LNIYHGSVKINYHCNFTDLDVLKSKDMRFTGLNKPELIKLILEEINKSKEIDESREIDESKYINDQFYKLIFLLTGYTHFTFRNFYYKRYNCFTFYYYGDYFILIDAKTVKNETIAKQIPFQEFEKLSIYKHFPMVWNLIKPNGV